MLQFYKKGAYMLKSIKKRNMMILVKEPNEFIQGRYKLNAFALKMLALLFSKVDPFNDKSFTKYEISVKEVQSLLGKSYGEIYNIVKNTFRNLIDIKLELEYEDQWKIFTIIVDPTILKRDGVITFFISPNLLSLLKNTKHYLQYDLSILAYFNSSYSLRLYKILKDKWETSKKFNKEPIYRISIEKLKKILQIPNTYLYGNIKQKVLKPALEEINKWSDISIRIEEIKKSRKVKEIIFYIDEKTNNSPNFPRREENLNSSLKEFRDKIITQYNNTNKYFVIDDNEFYIKEGLLFVNDEALKSSEALTWWKYIYKNRDKIKEIDPEELKKEALKEFNEFKELREKFINLPILVKYNNELKKAKIEDIHFQEAYKLYLLIDNFSLVKEFFSLQELKKFVEVSAKALEEHNGSNKNF